MTISTLLSFTAKIEAAYASLCQPILDEFSISKTAFDILMFLSEHPDRFTAKEISDTKNIRANVISIHVEKLVNSGYLERQSVAGDRRKVRLICTEQAQPILEQGRALHQHFFPALVDGLTDEEMENFKHCFQVVEANADRLQRKKSEG